MIDLFSGFSASLLIILLQVWVPGIIFCLLICRKVQWTFTDAFFVGVLWNALIGMFVVPIWSNTLTISIFVKIASLLLLIIFLFMVVYKKDSAYMKKIKAVIKGSFTITHFLLAAGVSLIALIFIATHNLGFDDVAHLKYIDGAIEGNPYPVYRDLVNRWEGARYPWFGIIIGSLGKGVYGSGLFLYYLFGIAILVAFILKIYEILSSSNSKQGYMAFAITLVIASVLMIGGQSNYFNFGIYPLEQAKLLATIGLTYLLVGWGIQRNLFYLFIGFSLFSLAALYHLNLILLYIVIAPLIFLFIYIRKQSRKQWFIYAAFLLMIPLLSVPAAISQNNGFLHYKEEPQKVSTGPKVEVKEKSRLEKIIIKAKKLLSWIENGRYKNKYIGRAFSLEIFLIPLIVIAAIYIGGGEYLNLFFTVIAILIFIQQLTVTVPKQFIASTFRSGTVWMVYDIVKSRIKFQNLTGNIFTDPYTGFYLKMLGVKGIKELNYRDELLSFSPLFSAAVRDSTTLRLATTKNDSFLLNSRFWGVTNKANWHTNKDEKLELLLEYLNDFNETGNVRKLYGATRSSVEYVKELFDAPILLYKPKYDGKKFVYQASVADILEKPIRIYHDAALLRLQNLVKGEKIVFEFEGFGIAQYFGHFAKNKDLKVFKKIKKKGAPNKLEFDVLENIDSVTLLFRMEMGHLNGLGTIDSLSIQRKGEGS